MRFLADTHVWLWLLADRRRLDPDLVSALEEREHELVVSTISVLEIAIKWSLGKLRLPQPPATYVPDRIRQSGAEVLDVAQAHALDVATLPLHHRDPFDRTLVAQARIEGLTLLTVDRILGRYEVPVRWADR